MLKSVTVYLCQQQIFIWNRKSEITKDSTNIRYLEYIHIPTRSCHVSPFFLQSRGSHQHSHLFSYINTFKDNGNNSKHLHDSIKNKVKQAYAHWGTVHWQGNFTFIVILDSKQNHSLDVFRKLWMPDTQLWFTYLVPEIFIKLSAVSKAVPNNKACTVNLYSKRQETDALSKR